MCEKLLPADYELNWVRYFTARVGGSATDPRQPQRQDVYIRALHAECRRFTLHEGAFRTDTDLLPLAGSSVEEPELVKVRVKQEKGSDVNLAIHLNDDASQEAMDLAIVVTDDYDQEGALKMARDHHEIQLMVVSPRNQRGLARSVRAEFYKPVHESLLLECQMPDLTVDHQGLEVHRPKDWENGEAAPKDGLLPSSRSN